MQIITIYINAIEDCNSQLVYLLPDLCNQIHGILEQTIQMKMTQVMIRDGKERYQFYIKYTLS